ncbi:hypothetical protein [Paremcibacter congregatus]|nr:hypothetical protein [Paremcibacter congregatus]QDE25990.1 hypothetical protein FIV45_01175 [Paremcibacter congregatus]
MMRKIMISILGLLVLSTAGQAATQCRAPLAPAIPDGKTAPKEEILAALSTIKKDFQPAIKNFQNCISTEKAAIGDVATEAQLAEWDQLFDAAYALETMVANKMNETIRAYKARAAAPAEPAAEKKDTTN